MEQKHKSGMVLITKHSIFFFIFYFFFAKAKHISGYLNDGIHFFSSVSNTSKTHSLHACMYIYICIYHQEQYTHGVAVTAFGFT